MALYDLTEAQEYYKLCASKWKIDVMLLYMYW